MKGLLITPEASVTEFVPANGRDFTLEELQKGVDGCIEIIDLTDKTIMVVNEDGKGRLYPNMMATVIAKGCRSIFPNDYIAGNAVLCASDMVK
jgi:hypothetical protein